MRTNILNMSETSNQDNDYLADMSTIKLINNNGEIEHIYLDNYIGGKGKGKGKKKSKAKKKKKQKKKKGEDDDDGGEEDDISSFDEDGNKVFNKMKKSKKKSKSDYKKSSRKKKFSEYEDLFDSNFVVFIKGPKSYNKKYVRLSELNNEINKIDLYKIKQKLKNIY